MKNTTRNNMEGRNMGEVNKARKDTKMSRILNFGITRNTIFPGILYRIMVVLAILIILPSVSSNVFGAQLPVPIESRVKAGDYSYSQDSTNMVGDRGAWSKPQFVDIDADGDYDMFVGRETGILEYWQNNGNDTNPSYAYVNNNLIADYNQYSSPSFIDFDRDGDFDILVGYQDGWLRYFENTGSAESPTFSHTRAYFDVGAHAMPAWVDYNNDGYYDFVYGRDDRYLRAYFNDVKNTGLFFDDFEMDDAGSYSTTAFVDMDGDADFDLIVGNSAGYIYYYENIGTVNDAEWAEEEYWFDVGSYSTPFLADFDDDGDYDMIIGNSGGTAVYYRNDGTTITPLWTLVDGVYTYDVGTYASPTAADMDGDGDLDLFVGNEAGVTAFYENTGGLTNPVFTLVTTALIGDVGDRIRPHAVDIDSDGDYDLLIGRSTGEVLLRRNDGNATSYSFVGAGSIVVGTYDYSAPSTADIDNDGDLDLAFGTGGNQGWVVIRENTGNVTHATFTNPNTWWFENMGTGNAHQFIDMDKDGDLDLVRGQENGYVYYYRNDGTTEEPLFVYVRYWRDYGAWSAPALADIDNDGDYDLTVGVSNNAYLQYYENVGSEASYNFEKTTDTWVVGDVGNYANTAFADMDDDGDKDMFVGRQNGQVMYYRNDGGIDWINFTQVSTNLVGDRGSYVYMDFGDIDDDGDLDMLAGYSDRSTVTYFRNNGNRTFMNFSVVTDNYMGGNCRNGDTQGYSYPKFVDLDSDGDLDILCANYYRGPYYWRNDGSAAVASWNPVGDIIGDPVDRGGTFDVVDMDSDGDMDIVIPDGRYNYIYYYRNDGSATSASFTYIYAGNAGNQWLPRMHTTEYNWPTPNMEDLDNDGDYDVIIGMFDGTIKYYENNGLYTTDAELADAPAWKYRTSNWFGTYCVSGVNAAHCTPKFGDFDADGDQDLVVGNYQGYLDVWKNTGTITSPSWAYWTRLSGNSLDYVNPGVGDMDGDGDLDIVAARTEGYIQLYKNVGTPEVPLWTFVQAGANGNRWGGDYGTRVYIDVFDYDGDGLTDISYVNDVGDFSMRKNKGIYPTEEMKAKNPTWVSSVTVRNIVDQDRGGNTNYYYNAPSFGDIDGDGDFDMLVGERYGEIVYYRNDGTHNSPSWTLIGNLGDIGTYAGAGIVDIDSDGDLDFYAGKEDGFVSFFKNNGVYTLSTLLTIKDFDQNAVSNANVEFSDDSGIVCNEFTDTDGIAKCEITYVGNQGSVKVTNATPGTVSILVASPNSGGSSFMTLENPSSNFQVDIERFVFQTHGKDYQPNTMQVEISDQGGIVASKPTRDGYLDIFLPKKYIKNMKEPFTQNRITYDVTFYENEDYAGALELEDVYVPNEINISSDNEYEKLFKFVATHEMSTGAEYAGYIIYPALKSQRGYNFTDNLPADFTYTGEVKAEYLDQECSFNASGLTSFSMNEQKSGCAFLGVSLQDDADWVKVSFKIKAPSLNLFLTNGWDLINYTSPAVELRLLS